MAPPANRAYLRALHANAQESPSRKSEGNRLTSVLYEINFAEFAQHIRARQWLDAEIQIARAVNALQAAGADFLVVTSNTGCTLTRIAREQCCLPILDIVQPVMSAMRTVKCRRAGLLSTRRTLESGMFQTVSSRYDLEVLAPSHELAESIEHLIMTELIYGEVTAAGLQTMITAAHWFTSQGADSLILGCTDMTHLATRLCEHTTLFVADTTRIHASAAANLAWNGVTVLTACADQVKESVSP